MRALYTNHHHRLVEVYGAAKVETLWTEYGETQERFFGRSMFAIVPNDDDAEYLAYKRHQNLFMFFFPEYRTKSFIHSDVLNP